MLTQRWFEQTLNISNLRIFDECCLITCQNVINDGRFKYLPVSLGCNFRLFSCWLFQDIQFNVRLWFLHSTCVKDNYHGVGKLIYFVWMAERIPISLQVCQVYCIPCVFIISFYSLSYLFTFWHNKFFNGSESAVTEWKWHVAYNYALKHRSQQYSLLIEAEWLLKLSKKRNCV